MRALGMLFLGLGLCIASGVRASNFSDVQLCKAALASEMGASLKTIKALNPQEGTPAVTYIRADGTQWTYSCRIEGDRVLWRVLMTEVDPQRWGRWHDSPLDSTIQFATIGNLLVIKNTQGETLKIRPSDF